MRRFGLRDYAYVKPRTKAQFEFAPGGSARLLFNRGRARLNPAVPTAVRVSLIPVYMHTVCRRVRVCAHTCVNRTGDLRARLSAACVRCITEMRAGNGLDIRRLWFNRQI